MESEETNIFADPFDEDTLEWADNTPKTPKWPAELVERAMLLFDWDSGWSYLPGPVENLYILHGPDGICHTVHLGSDHTAPYCTCPTFRAEAMCVHFLGIEHELFYQAWIRAEEERLEGAEHPVYGCDPYMHYDRCGNPDN